MQLKMHNILGFSNLYETVKAQKLPMKTAYKFAQLARAVEVELQFYQDKFNTIIREYGLFDENGQLVPTEDGSGIKLREGTEVECYGAIGELQAIDIELPDITFTIEEFSNVELTVVEMDVLMPFMAN
jgi:hypothetical protein